EKPAASVSRGACLANLGLALQQADPGKCLDPYAKAIAVLRKVAADDPADRTAQTFLRNAVFGRATALGKLTRHKDSLADWGWLVDLEPADRRADMVASRTLVLARVGEHERAAAEAGKLADAADGQRLYNLACTLSLCSAAAAADSARADGYAGRSVGYLRRAA